jgi:membrane protein DedA with SNARE-associated domain
VVRTFVSLPLGIARMDFKRFVFYSLAGSLPWTVVLVYGGKVLGDNWENVTRYGDWYNLAIICLLAVILLYLGIKKFRKR